MKTNDRMMARSSAHGLALFVALLLVAPVAAAQEAKPARSMKTADRLDAIEARLAEIGNTLGELVGGEPPSSLRTRVEALQDNFDALLRDIDALRAGLEEAAARGEDREDRLDHLGDEVANIWSEIEEIKSSVEELTEAETAGYDEGFFIGSRDGRHRLRINGYVNPYYRLGLQKSWDRTRLGDLAYDDQGQPSGGDVEVRENAFGLAAARLILSAQVFETVRMVAEIDYGTQTGLIQFPTNADGRTTNVGYSRVDIDRHALSFKSVYAEFAPLPELRLRAGQFKPGFDRETLFSSNQLTFTSQSLMTRRHARFAEEGIPEDALTYRWDYEVVRGSSFGYDRGFQAAGCVAEGVLKYFVGAYNGGGPNAGNDNRDVLFTARLESDFLGMMTPGMSDLDTVQRPLVGIGAGFAYDLPRHRDGIDPLRTYNSKEISITGDLQAKWMGAAFLASVFYRTADHGAARPAGLDAMGISGQLSYFNAFTGIEPAVRYGFYDPDIDRSLDHVHEFTAALKYHVVPGHLNLMVEWRGLFPAQKDQSYLAPWKVWFEDLHEIMVMAQAEF